MNSLPLRAPSGSFVTVKLIISVLLHSATFLSAAQLPIAAPTKPSILAAWFIVRRVIENKDSTVIFRNSARNFSSKGFAKSPDIDKRFFVIFNIFTMGKGPDFLAQLEAVMGAFMGHIVCRSIIGNHLSELNKNEADLTATTARP